MASSKTSLTDTVTYEGLTPGQEYVVRGELMDKETGKGTGIKAEASFKAEKSEGTVDIVFKGDTSKMAGKSLVAFEYLYRKTKDAEVEVARHTDIEDKDQTVAIEKEPEPTKKPTEKKVENVDTGDKPIALYVGIAVVLLAVLACALWFFFRRRRLH